MRKVFYLLPLFLISCSFFLTQGFHQHISVDQAVEIIENHSFDKNFVILDVRTSKEYVAGHIHQAVNINYLNKNFQKNIKEYSKDKTYLVYCKGGIRSQRAMETMKELGFKKIYNMKPGIIGWVDSQKGLVK